uniref:Ribulose bisphosphate carboxylase large subunit C-terminal domain-containing protein n=1 Tax=Alexandrium monilatum TaxID=311494 RepID=A0A7S4TBH6_9DINO
MAAADGLRGKATRLVAQPTTNSTRAWKRHLARLRQETTIKELRQLNDALELELAKWYEWWYEIPANRASPLCTKAAKIVDELAARDGYAAKARRPFSHPHQCYRWLRGCNSEEAEDYRRKVRARNEAAHASAPEFEEEFDIWALLGGMATLAPAPICGGVLLPGPPVGDFLPEGDALHNIISNKRSEPEADIVRIRALGEYVPSQFGRGTSDGGFVDGPIIKPRLDLQPKSFGEACRGFQQGGGIMKDDESQSNQIFCQMDEFIPEAVKATHGGTSSGTAPSSSTAPSSAPSTCLAPSAAAPSSAPPLASPACAAPDPGRIGKEVDIVVAALEAVLSDILRIQAAIEDARMHNSLDEVAALQLSMGPLRRQRDRLLSKWDSLKVHIREVIDTAREDEPNEKQPKLAHSSTPSSFSSVHNLGPPIPSTPMLRPAGTPANACVRSQRLAAPKAHRAASSRKPSKDRNRGGLPLRKGKDGKYRARD